MHCQYSGVAVDKSISVSYIYGKRTMPLTAGNCHIISMVAGSTDGCAVLTGEEVEEIGGVAAHIVQENLTTTLTKSVKKKKKKLNHIYMH